LIYDSFDFLCFISILSFSKDDEEDDDEEEDDYEERELYESLE